MEVAANQPTTPKPKRWFEATWWAVTGGALESIENRRRQEIVSCLLLVWLRLSQLNGRKTTQQLVLSSFIESYNKDPIALVGSKVCAT